MSDISLTASVSDVISAESQPEEGSAGKVVSSSLSPPVWGPTNLTLHTGCSCSSAPLLPITRRIPGPDPGARRTYKYDLIA